MNKENLKKKINENKSIREIACEYDVSYTTVKYWLGKHGLKTNYIRKKYRSKKVGTCSICDKEITGKNVCGGCYVKIRRYRTKAHAIDLFGGKCVRCGWSGPQAGFSFHHLQDKKNSIAKISNKSWKVVKEELDKCILLCCNCHSIEHSNVHDRFLKVVDEYNGKDFID
ncbi:MAG: hypothetical protein H8D23_10800 [Candidatus Brocadiales bacterium]|nr:hypothetical protein [Candidatus Brocadiales bacterium]